jgi:hypothetical protein
MPVRSHIQLRITLLYIQIDRLLCYRYIVPLESTSYSRFHLRVMNISMETARTCKVGIIIALLSGRVESKIHLIKYETFVNIVVSETVA